MVLGSDVVPHPCMAHPCMAHPMWNVVPVCVVFLRYSTPSLERFTDAGKVKPRDLLKYDCTVSYHVLIPRKQGGGRGVPGTPHPDD